MSFWPLSWPLKSAASYFGKANANDDFWGSGMTSSYGPDSTHSDDYETANGSDLFDQNFGFNNFGFNYEAPEPQPEEFASVLHSLWWAVATLTTVGYGDIYPITLGGRVFTFLVLIVGVGVVALPCGVIASALSEARRMEQ